MLYEYEFDFVLEYYNDMLSWILKILVHKKIIILTQSQLVFAVPCKCCMLSIKAKNTNFKVFGLIRQGLKPPYSQPCEEHASTKPQKCSFL